MGGTRVPVHEAYLDRGIYLGLAKSLDGIGFYDSGELDFAFLEKPVFLPILSARAHFFEDVRLDEQGKVQQGRLADPKLDLEVEDQFLCLKARGLVDVPAFRYFSKRPRCR